MRSALALINQVLTEGLSEQEDEVDNDTRWAIAGGEQHGFEVAQNLHLCTLGIVMRGGPLERGRRGPV